MRLRERYFFLESSILARHKYLNQTRIFFLELADDVFDYNEAANFAKAERRAVLWNYVPLDDDPMPSGLSRWAAVRFRKIPTDTANTPVVLGRVNRTKKRYLLRGCKRANIPPQGLASSFSGTARVCAQYGKRFSLSFRYN